MNRQYLKNQINPRNSIINQTELNCSCSDVEFFSCDESDFANRDEDEEEEEESGEILDNRKKAVKFAATDNKVEICKISPQPVLHRGFHFNSSQSQDKTQYVDNQISIERYLLGGCDIYQFHLGQTSPCVHKESLCESIGSASDDRSRLSLDEALRVAALYANSKGRRSTTYCMNSPINSNLLENRSTSCSAKTSSIQNAASDVVVTLKRPSATEPSAFGEVKNKRSIINNNPSTANEAPSETYDATATHSRKKRQSIRVNSNNKLNRSANIRRVRINESLPSGFQRISSPNSSLGIVENKTTKKSKSNCATESVSKFISKESNGNCEKPSRINFVRSNPSKI